MSVSWYWYTNSWRCSPVYKSLVRLVLIVLMPLDCFTHSFSTWRFKLTIGWFPYVSPFLSLCKRSPHVWFRFLTCIGEGLIGSPRQLVRSSNSSCRVFECQQKPVFQFHWFTFNLKSVLADNKGRFQGVVLCNSFEIASFLICSTTPMTPYISNAVVDEICRQQ